MRHVDMTITHPFGRTLHLLRASNIWNGADTAPAVITRVWSAAVVNVLAFPDGMAPTSYTSIPLVADRKAAETMTDEQIRHGNTTFVVAYWPTLTPTPSPTGDQNGPAAA